MVCPQDKEPLIFLGDSSSARPSSGGVLLFFYHEVSESSLPQPMSTVCPSWQCTQEASGSVFSPATHEEVEDNNEIPLLQTGQIQASQAFVASPVLQALNHIRGLLLDSLQFPSGFSALGSPELDTELEKWPWKSGVKRITTTSLSLLLHSPDAALYTGSFHFYNDASLTFSTNCSPGSPNPFPVRLLPRWSFPNVYSCTVQDFALVMLNFVRFHSTKEI